MRSLRRAIGIVAPLAIGLAALGLARLAAQSPAAASSAPGMQAASAAPASAAALDPLIVSLRSAVLERMGPTAEVRVGTIAPAWSGAFSRVTLDPAAKIGDAIWVTVFTGPASTVRLRAAVTVIADYVTVSRPIVKGQIIEAADLTPVRGVVAGVPFRRLPVSTQLVGARALRPMEPGETVQPGFVSAVPVVRAGQTVTALVHVDAVEVSASFVAVDSGATDDIIRIFNPETKKMLRARVVSSSTVEVINVL